VRWTNRDGETFTSPLYFSRERAESFFYELIEDPATLCADIFEAAPAGDVILRKYPRDER
jgi:hypothetical protein